MENLCMRDVVKIDLNKGLSRTYAGMVLATGDNMANCFGAALYRGGEPVDITGYSVMGYFIRKSGAETVLIQGKANGNEAIVELPQACYTSDGGFSLAIKVSGADVTATVRVVDGAIRLTQTGTMIDPGDVVPSLDELFAKIEEMEAVTAEGEATIAAIKADTAAAIKTTNEATAATQTATVELAKTAAPAITPTVSGSIVTITDGAERPAVSLVSHIEPVQEGEGDPSPDNVRPISGWDSVTAQRTGKNLIDPERLNASNSGDAMATASADAYTITVTGSAAYSCARYDIRENIKPGATMYMACDSCDGELQIEFTGENNLRVSVSSSHLSSIFTVPEEFENAYLKLYANNTAANLSSANTYTYKGARLSFVEGAAWEPYQPIQTLSASLPETVYGGTVDWTTGVLTVEWIYLEFDGSEPWGLSTGATWTGANGNGFYIDICVYYGVGRGALDVPPVCSAYKGYTRVGLNTSGENAVSLASICNEIAFAKTQFATVDKWTAHLAALKAAGTPLQVVYKLITPYTIQLTPQQLETLKGTNNVWSDTGDTDLTYIADTQLYIDQKFSALEAALLSTGANV